MNSLYWEEKDAELAIALQLEEDESAAKANSLSWEKEDAELARTLQSMEAESAHWEGTETQVAVSLQFKKAESAANAKREEEQRMLLTSTGKAFSFVQQVLASVPTKSKLQGSSLTAGGSDTPASLAPSNGKDVLLAPVSRDDMVAMAERLFSLQEEFQRNGIDPHVDVCYHYTNERNMVNIQEHGLLTAEELTTTGQLMRKRFLTFGPGIYTGNNPFAFSRHGNVGIMVARLKGNTARTARYESHQRTTSNVNTVIGNQYHPSDVTGHFDEVVLQTSKQVVPLVRFCASMTRGDNNVNQLYDVQETLQSIVDKVCNSGRKTATTRTTHSECSWLKRDAQIALFESLRRPAAFTGPHVIFADVMRRPAAFTGPHVIPADVTEIADTKIAEKKIAEKKIAEKKIEKSNE